MIGWAVCLTLIVGFFWMPAQVSSPNERSRLYLAHALVDRGQVQVTPEWQRWGKIFDIAHRDGQFYSDKAPGSSVLAAPVVALSRATAQDPGQLKIEVLVQRARSAVILPLVFLSALALMKILLMLGLSAPFAYLGALLLCLGTNVLHYGHAYFGHVPVMAFSLAALWALLGSLRAQDNARKQLLGALSGLCCGLCFAVEYQAALVSICLGLGLLADPKTRHPRHWGAMGLSALPVIALVLAYNHAAFGGPLATSYEHLYWKFSKELHNVGVGGVGLPTMEAISGLLFSPSRGLWFSCPWMIAGGYALWRKDAPLPRWLKVAASVMAVAFFYVASGFGMWSAGWGVGPRLMIPAFGGLAILGIVGLAQLWRDQRVLALGASLGLGAAAVLVNVVLTATFPENPEQFLVPMRDVGFKLLGAGYFAPSLLEPVFGARASGLVALSLVVLMCAASVALVWRAGAQAQGEEGAGARLSKRAALGAAALMFAAWCCMMWSYPVDTHTQKPSTKHVEWVKGLKR